MPADLGKAHFDWLLPVFTTSKTRNGFKTGKYVRQFLTKKLHGSTCREITKSRAFSALSLSCLHKSTRALVAFGFPIDFYPVVLVLC